MNTVYTIIGLVVIIILVAFVYAKPWDNMGGTSNGVLYELKITAEGVSIDSLRVNGKLLPKERILYGLSGEKVGKIDQIYSGKFTEGRVYIHESDLKQAAQKVNQISLTIRGIDGDSPFFHASLTNHIGETDGGVNIELISLDDVRLEGEDFESIDLPYEINLNP